jgi:hypothetical protein
LSASARASVLDKVGEIAVGYSVSSNTMHPAIRYTGRVPTDPLGTLESEATIIQGTGSQLRNLNRWGDYSSMAIDPVDAIWVLQLKVPFALRYSLVYQKVQPTTAPTKHRRRHLNGVSGPMTKATWR